jgi:hypothetical protein
MPKVASQIIGSFENIGKDVIREATKLPKDIVGSALESLSPATPKGQKQQTVLTGTSEKIGNTNDQWDSIDKVGDTKIKQAVAREALTALLSRKAKKEPSIWDRIQSDEKQKIEREKQQAALTAKSSLPVITGKRPKGDLYGMKAKKNSAEMSRNVRQD